MDKPTAWYDPTNHHVSTDKNDPLFTPLGQVWPLYPQRPWVGLTDEEVESFDVHAIVDAECVRAIEAKLKEKNT